MGDEGVVEVVVDELGWRELLVSYELPYESVDAIFDDELVEGCEVDKMIEFDIFF